MTIIRRDNAVAVSFSKRNSVRQNMITCTVVNCRPQAKKKITCAVIWKKQVSQFDKNLDLGIQGFVKTVLIDE